MCASQKNRQQLCPEFSQLRAHTHPVKSLRVFLHQWRRKNIRGWLSLRDLWEIFWLKVRHGCRETLEVFIFQVGLLFICTRCNKSDGEVSIISTPLTCCITKTKTFLKSHFMYCIIKQFWDLKLPHNTQKNLLVFIWTPEFIEELCFSFFITHFEVSLYKRLMEMEN